MSLWEFSELASFIMAAPFFLVLILSLAFGDT